MAADPVHPKTDAAGEINAPIIIDLGKKNRKQVRKMAKGKPGRLMDSVEEVIANLRENGTMAADAQPLVIVIRKRSKRPGGRMTKAFGLG